MHRLGRHPQGEAAVADTVGSILMVAITVIMATVLGGLLLAFKGPVKTDHADLSVTVDPGQGGWNTGDETVRILHRGGDPVQAAATTVAVTIGGTTTRFSGAAGLGSAWADGVLTAGELWSHTFTIASGAAVAVAVTDNPGGASTLLSSSTIVAQATSSTQPCTADHAIPTVALWTQSPAIVTRNTVGAVGVTAQLTDDCWGVNPAVKPDLFWRIGTSGSYTDQGQMNPAGTNRWSGSIPAQAWSSLVGSTIQYHIGPVADLGPNTGNTPDTSFVVQNDCSLDNNPPTASSFTASPSDVKSTTSGSVTVTLVATDDCAGVLQTVTPSLYYRFNDGTNPGYSGPVSTALTGTSTWAGVIPSQTWALLAGKTMEYYMTGFQDNNHNVGTTAVNQDLVDIVATYTYVASNTPTAGTVTNFANAQSASDSNAVASLAEKGTAGSPNTILLSANNVVSSTGWTSPTSAFASDNVYATYSTASPTSANDLKLDVQDPVVTTGVITQVVLQAEVSISGYSNDGFQVYACLSGGSCDALSATGGQSATDTNINYDITALRPGGGSWTWTDIQNLQGVVRMIQSGTKDGTWRVDYLSVQVTSVTTTYSTDIGFGWTLVPAGTTHILDLNYAASGDTFNVLVCQDALPTCGTWTARGTQLTAPALTVWTYTLTTAEYDAGSPRIRFTDASPTGVVQGILSVEYARVDTI